MDGGLDGRRIHNRHGAVGSLLCSAEHTAGRKRLISAMDIPDMTASFCMKNRLREKITPEAIFYGISGNCIGRSHL
jgi:hypothetical protein